MSLNLSIFLSCLILVSCAVAPKSDKIELHKIGTKYHPGSEFTVYIDNRIYRIRVIDDDNVKILSSTRL